MDEGLGAHWTKLAVMKIFNQGNGAEDIIGRSNPGKGIIGTVADIPLMISSEFLTRRNYRYAAYGKPGYIFAMIHHYMGEELFSECCRAYVRRWAGKSPTPYDLFYTFEHVSGQDLSWIWKPWFFEFGYPDVRIESLNMNNLTIEMAGNQPVPLVIEVMYDDGSSRTIKENVGIWSTGIKKYTVSIPGHSKVTDIMVNRNVPDVDLSDNVYRSQ
jgi:aminopeptidase N